MHRFLVALGVIAVVSVAPSRSLGATIGFEIAGPTVAILKTHFEAGFLVEALGPQANSHAAYAEGTLCLPVTCASNGTMYARVVSSAFNGAFADRLEIVATDLSQFTFHGFDAGEFFSTPFQDNSASGIRVTGFRADATVWTRDFGLDGINDGVDGVADFQTFSARNFFGTFVRVRFEGLPNETENVPQTEARRTFALDNVVLLKGIGLRELEDGYVPDPSVSEVPEPGTWLLLASALTAMALRRRAR